MLAALLSQYQAAVALNNMGVALLLEQRFLHSFETFRDAITVMENVVKGGEYQDHQVALTSILLQKAQLCQSQGPPPHQAASLLLSRGAALLPVIRAVSHDAPLTLETFRLPPDHQEEVQVAPPKGDELEARQSMLTCSAIRISANYGVDLIDDDETNEDQKDQDRSVSEAFAPNEVNEASLHLPTAIILYNLSIACWCRSRQSRLLEAEEQQHLANKLLRDTLRFLSLCQTLLQGSIAESDNAFIVSRGLLFGSLAFKLRLLVVQQRGGHEDEHEVLRCRLVMQELEIKALRILCTARPHLASQKLAVAA